MSETRSEVRGERSSTISIAGPGEMISSNRPFFLVAALCLLVIATALRAYHLGNRSLWFDEAVTANTSRGTLTQMLDETRLRLTSPILYPSILYVVERVSKNAAAVRAPSLLASVLAVLVMLAMVRANVSRSAALFAAAILAVSTTQIRYAQEVREYALSVLWGALLAYCLLRWEATGSRSRQPIWLYVTLFFAPVIQYGLVFLAFGILSTIVLRILFSRDTHFRVSHVVTASISLAAGALFAFVVALRYQFHYQGRVFWFMLGNYFDPKSTTLLHFISTNTSGLLAFLIPQHIVRLCVVFGAIIFCVARVVTRKWDPSALLIFTLAFTSVAITLCASIVRAYPYGGVRQCLFLTPVVALFAGVVFADFVQYLKGSLQPAVIVLLLFLICLSGYRGIRRQSPYQEYEDTVSILRELAKSSTPNDQVWINYDAVEAVDFYLPGRDHRFIYGKFHGAALQDYVSELFRSIDPHRDRIWLVFSHLQQKSDRVTESLIVNSLQLGWDVHCVLTPTNTALYVAHRRTSQ